MRSRVASVLLTLASIALGASVAGWWLQRSVFDPARTRDVAAAVLSHDSVRDEVAERISVAVASQFDQDPAVVRIAVARAASTPAGAEVLAEVVVHAHAKLVGLQDDPVQITPQQVARVVDDQRAESLPPVVVPVPTIGVLDTGRKLVDRLVGPLFIGGLVAAALAWIIHPDKARMLAITGGGLVIVAVLMVVIALALPLAVPAITSSAWADALPELARDQAPTLIGIALVVFGAGCACVAAALALRRQERLRVARAAPQPPAGYTW